jgi:hypothetical protein
MEVSLMPNCFSLTRKSKPDKGPVSLIEIDEEICKLFEIEPNDRVYYRGWVDWIGFLLACGHSFEKIRQDKGIQSDEQMLQICNYLDENYTSQAWYQARY